MKPQTLPAISACAAALLLLVAFSAPAQDDEMEDVVIDPLTDLALDMEAVAADLSVQETGQTTQETQATIVRKLDALIEQLERELEAGAGGASGANPQRPLQDSMIIGGPGGMGDLRTPRDLGKNWGELPPKERERILQSLTEGFPPHYQKILEHYYRRLAAEQSAADPGETGGAGQDRTDLEGNTPPAAADANAAAGQTSGPDSAADAPRAGKKSKRPSAKRASKAARQPAAAEGGQ